MTYNEAQKQKNLFNQSYTVHITPLVIHGLGGGHTHAYIRTEVILRNQARAWFKNTAKVLIGILPQGVVGFVSEAWGGRVSDKYLTEHCGILRKLLPGDVVLADRGFDIAESVGSMQAKLHILAFTKGKTQLSAVEVEETRKIANVRIHVERVIGAVRQGFPILQSTLPIHYVMKRNGEDIPLIDRMVRVCCALNNVCNSVVPFD